MKIIIPSKNIYNIDNSKIIDNLIDNVKLETTVVIPNNEYETLVNTHKKEYEKNDYIETDYGNRSYVYTDFPSDAFTRYTGTYSSCKLYYVDVSFSLSALGKNSYISKIHNHKDEETGQGKEISWSFVGRRSITPVTAISNLDRNNPQTTNFNYGNTLTYDYQVIELPKVKNNLLGDVYIGIELNDESYINYELKNGKYDFNCRFLSAVEYEKLSGFLTVGNLVSPTPTPIEGYKEYIETKEIKISIYGDIIGVSLENGSVTYGEGNRPFSLNGSELMQESNTIYGNKSAIEDLSKKVLEQYKNGKETATLLCDIGEYHYQSGEKAISPSEKGLPMTFDIGDEVVPMIYGADGKDYPMSINDGVQKSFRVVGIRLFYDGAVWQELTLQEI